MNIIHSCWTAPMTSTNNLRWNINNQIELNLWLYGYSVDYLQRLGVRIDLYTDTYGSEIFSCLPYKNIYTNLDELNGTTNERFWSAGKIIALRDAPLGTVHIDGDVFLKKQEVLDALDMTDHDCMVQMHERMSVFMESYKEVLPMYREAVGDRVSGFTYNLTEAVNCGVLGFNNQQMKDEFIAGYIDILKICQSDQNFMSLLKYDLKKKIEPNVVIEQYFLKSLATVGKYTIKDLLELKSDDLNDDLEIMNLQADSLGFAHAWGSSKYQAVPLIRDILEQRNPDLYKAIQAKVIEIHNI